jgi:F0F1-type ATP synthase delta subunit
LEYARDPGAEFLDQLTGTLVEKTGAAGVRLSTRVVPELLAGCRLRIGGGLIDASLQTRLRQLEAELAGGSPRAGPLMEVF